MEITNDKGEKVEVFTKEEMEATKAELTKKEKELEDTRMEVLTPEYTAFLESYKKDKEEGGKSKEKSKEDEEDLSKLTPKELVARAKKEALDEFNATLDKQKKETKDEKESRNKREIASFAKTHPDFEEFRPLMYGLSLKADHADLTLPELYEAAKAHVKKIKTGTTEEDKTRQRKMSNEKPGGGNDTFNRKDAKSGIAYGQEAFAEVEKELGPLPPA